MSRLGLLNILSGFTVLFLSASAGAFLANDITAAFIADKELLDTWQMTLLRSAHGHFNLFGILQILLGLTLPYSPWNLTVKKSQTVGLFLATLAIGPGLMIRAYTKPSVDLDLTAILVGLFLSLGLLTLLSHAAGIGYKLFKRS